MPPIYYTIGPKTEKMAIAYLSEIKANPGIAGTRLAAFLNAETLKDWFDTDLEHLTVNQFISTLMCTKKPEMHHESDAIGTDWSATELKILSNISLHCLDTDAYNDGGKCAQATWTDFPKPQHEHVIYINSAVFTSSEKPGSSYDTPDLIVDGKPDAAAIFRHYEEKLIPCLLDLNKTAGERGEKVVLNIPDLCCQRFTGPFEQPMRQLLPRILQHILQSHAQELTNIHTINYDPAHASGIDEKDMDVDIDGGEGRKIHFQMRPFQNEKEKRAPLEFPAGFTEEQIKQQHLVIAKLISGSPVSWPGNDVWANKIGTDDSATFTSVNALSKMLSAKTFVITKPNAEYQVKYNSNTGCEQFCKQEKGADIFLEHSQAMSELGLKYVAHSYNIFTIDYLEKPQLAEEQGQSARESHSFWRSLTSGKSKNKDENFPNTPSKS